MVRLACLVAGPHLVFLLGTVHTRSLLHCRAGLDCPRVSSCQFICVWWFVFFFVGSWKHHWEGKDIF